jgi:DNA-binding CsgD family transcriptional regulator
MLDIPATDLAKDFLAYFGNTTPSDDQIHKMTQLLINVFINSQILLDMRLSKAESTCLLLAAQGNTSIETAKILNISKATVESHRKEIKRKLGCNTIAHAVYLGVRYGYVKYVKS